MKKLPENDHIRLQHMLDAAYQAQHFIVGYERKDLETDTKLTFALVRALEIVGEAASYITDKTRQTYHLS
jgi:uncharacterized protein with HEPN domain